MKKLIDVECVTGMETRANTSEVYTAGNGRKLVILSECYHKRPL